MKIKPKQIAAINAYIAGVRHSDIAKAAGVTPQTFSAWLRDKDFQDMIAKRTEQLADKMDARLHGLTEKAIDVLEVSLEDNTPPHIRLNAALKIIDIVLKDI